MSIIKRLLLFVFATIGTGAYAQKKNISNPIIPEYFADPTIIVENNKFYLYATIDPWGGDSLAFWVSNDFKNWEGKPLNWPTKTQCTSKTSNDSKVWTPSVIKGKDNRYHIFVSVGSEVYAGVSDAPEGPWKNVKADGGPFIATRKLINVHTIDAEVFLNDNGKAYLYWGSGWNWKDGHCFVAELNEQMDTFISTPKDITPPGYFEAPYMLKRNGVYYTSCIPMVNAPTVLTKFVTLLPTILMVHGRKGKIVRHFRLTLQKISSVPAIILFYYTTRNITSFITALPIPIHKQKICCRKFVWMN
jgi:hypothetical protein